MRKGIWSILTFLKRSNYKLACQNHRSQVQDCEELALRIALWVGYIPVSVVFSPCQMILAH